MRNSGPRSRHPSMHSDGLVEKPMTGGRNGRTRPKGFDMRRTCVQAAAALLTFWLLGPTIASAQSEGYDFDPARPFAKINSPDQWVRQFQTGKPALDPNDRFRNLISREWVDSWTKRARGLSNEEFLKSYSGRGGTGVRIRSPYPYQSAKEHYDAWLKAANGGTKPTRANLPDWSGDWQGLPRGVLIFRALLRDV